LGEYHQEEEIISHAAQIRFLSALSNLYQECVVGLQNHKQLLEAANTALRQKNFKLHRDLTSQEEQSKQVKCGFGLVFGQKQVRLEIIGKGQGYALVGKNGNSEPLTLQERD